MANQPSCLANLLSPAILAWLDRLLWPTAGSGAILPGHVLSKNKGRSCEFSEHREYRAGDDFSALDWKVWARSDRLYVKQFEDEREQNVAILLDTSQSMTTGGPAASEQVNKLEYACQIAAAMAYLNLANSNRLALATFSDKLQAYPHAWRGKACIHRLMEFLQNLKVQGCTNFEQACQQFCAKSRHHEHTLVISDFLVPDGGTSGLQYLLGKHKKLSVIQILDASELQISTNGELELVDCETQQARCLTMDIHLVQAYNRALSELCQQLRQWCCLHQATYVQLSTDTAFHLALMQVLAKVSRR